MKQHAIVMGAGLAGIAAAVRLAAEGSQVTLIETSRRLGGRASSHDDPATAQTIDNCQHVLMGCCTNLLDLYERLGVADHVQWHPKLFFADKQGHVDVMQASAMPAPLHLSAAMLGFRTLNLRDKLGISGAMLAMMRISAAQRRELADVSFGDWLRSHGQTQRAMDRFWSVVIVSALNQTVDRAAAPYAIQVFQDGFLAHRRAFVMGTSAVPLRQLYDPAKGIVEAAGGQVRLGESIERMHVERDRIRCVELDTGERFEAEVYISALPFDRIARVLPPEVKLRDARFAGLDEFRHSPIIGIHLWFDRRVMELPHLIFVDSPLQWVFDKTVAEADGGAAAAGQYLHGVISAADAWVDKPAEQIVAMAVEELRQYLPATREATLVRGKAIKEKRATFSPAPGIERHRPAAAGTTANLLLAGDWTASGWPATMEGAVRSGYLAAAAAMSQPHSPLVGDLPVSRLYRLVAGTGSWRSSRPVGTADIKG